MRPAVSAAGPPSLGKEQPRRAVQAGGAQLSKKHRRAGDDSTENTPLRLALQARRIIAGIRVSPEVAAIVAGLAFGEARP
jgi:hypothetical protein